MGNPALIDKVDAEPGTSGISFLSNHFKAACIPGGMLIGVVGKANVGKSTLFNRLVGRRLALVDDRPGVTRDRREGEAELGGHAVTIVDTDILISDVNNNDLSGRSIAGDVAVQTELFGGKKIDAAFSFDVSIQ